jgi:MoaA/NifB/PqqE/SkfB family radical SAM enzyme/SAM-dependent methyltransferase
MKFIEKSLLTMKIIAKKPSLLISLINNYARLFLRLETNRSLAISITNNCNMNCIHCSNSSLAKIKSTNFAKNQNEPLTTKKIINILEQAKKLNFIQINLTGGEPFLNKDLFKICEKISNLGMICGINTNGSLIKKDNINNIKKYIDVISISLESFDKEEHNKFRKCNSFNQTLDVLKLLKSNKIPFFISKTVTHEDFTNNKLQKFLDICKSKKYNVTLSPAANCGTFTNNKNLLTTEDIKQLNYILKKNKNFARTDKDGNYIKRGCSAGNEIIYISNFGDILPCDFIQIEFGNIKYYPLKKLIHNIRRFKIFREKHKDCLPSENIKFQKDFIIPYVNEQKPINFSKIDVLSENESMFYDTNSFLIYKNKHLKKLLEYTFDNIFLNSTNITKSIKNQTKITNKDFTLFNNLLDVGTGCGFYLPILKKYAKNIHASDYNNKMISLSKNLISVKKLKNTTIHKDNIINSNFKNKQFDSALGYNVLHHLDNPKKAISEIHRILSDNGIYMGVEPNVWNPFVFLFHLFKSNERQALNLRIDNIKNKFKDFKKIEIKYDNTVQIGANKYTLFVVKLISKFLKFTHLEFLSFNYIIIAKK